MKPLKLTMSAFGPYASTEIIDFTELENRKLFLITGPTGSGKTTVFDAISIAMFGETSGNVRSVESLRSQFAEPEKLTEIRLEFKLKETDYIIHRIPKQMKKKLRGDGLSEQKPEATLTFVKNGEEKIITGIRSVNEKIEEIMGINADQFRQIMMIPQGDFRKLLNEDSQEREKVLQKLFDTKIYNKVQYSLDNKAKEIYGSIKDNEKIREHDVSRLEYDKGEKLDFLVNSEDLNIPQIIKHLEEQTNDDYVNIEIFKKQIDKFNLNIEDLINKSNVANNNNKLLSEKGLVKDEIGKLEKQKSQILELEDKVEKIGKAEILIESEENFKKREMEFDENNKEVLKTDKEIKKNDMEFSMVEKEYLFENSKDRQKERDELSREIERFIGYQSKVKELDDLKASIDENVKKSDEIINSKKSNEKTIDDNLEKIINLKKLKDEAMNAVIDLEKLKNNIDKSENENIKINDAIRLYKELKIYETKEEKSLEEFKNDEIHLEELKIDYKRMKLNFIMNQAAILAEDLNEGDACPVCGSTSHVRLAEYTDDAVSEDELNRSESKFEKYNLVVNKSREVHVRVSEEKNQCKMNYKKAIDDIDVSGSIEKAKDLLVIKENELSQYYRQREKLVSLIDKSKGMDGQIKELESVNEKKVEENKNLENSYKALNDEHIEKNTILNRIVAEVPKELHDYGVLSSKIKKKEMQRESENKKIEEIAKSYNDVKEKRTVLRTGKENLVKNKTRLQEAVDISKSGFDKKLKEMKFIDMDEYYLYRDSIDKLDSYKVKIGDFNKRYNELKVKESELISKTKDLDVVDVNKYAVEINEIKEKRTEATEKQNVLKNRVNNNLEYKTEIESISKKIKEKEDRYLLIGDLAKVAKGDNPSKITFERYVLAAFLEDIIIAANRRLIKMTGNRYYLSRTDELERKNKQSGLELKVFDNYSGKFRHVKTLSGGESFKASLSMALGLSDVVQSYAGGVRLDTMFIDEGFGTLDPESLDHAIDCMIDLQNSGRLVGIISHVPELKERIDALLEVRATTSGSTTQFIV
ncbi:MAG: AAA family ATPase [Bacillota bacterium]|nr:AAA family ATPase [Bacillota bacterium]